MASAEFKPHAERDRAARSGEETEQASSDPLAADRQIKKALKASDPVYLGKGFADAKPQPPDGSSDSPPALIAAGGPTKPARKIMSIKNGVKKQFSQSYEDGARRWITFTNSGPSINLRSPVARKLFAHKTC